MKFTIRGLFLVTMIVALAVGWWVDRSLLAVHLRPYLKMEQDYKEYLSMPENNPCLPQSSAPAPNPPKP